jgi:hypothetical protein
MNLFISKIFQYKPIHIFIIFWLPSFILITIELFCIFIKIDIALFLEVKYLLYISLLSYAAIIGKIVLKRHILFLLLMFLIILQLSMLIYADFISTTNHRLAGLTELSILPIGIFCSILLAFNLKAIENQKNIISSNLFVTFGAFLFLPCGGVFLIHNRIKEILK